MLDLSRVESGNVDIKMKDVDVEEIMQSCLALIELRAESRQLQLIDNVIHKGYMVKADFMRLKQVMLNLLSNAVKYNSEQGTITIESKIIDNRTLRISVTDRSDEWNHWD